MDKSQETTLMALIEEVAKAIGQPSLYDKILALLKENSELSQKLSQISTNQDEALQSLDEEHSIREVEVSLRRNEDNLRREINETEVDFNSIKNFAELQLKRTVDIIKTEEPTVKKWQRIVSERTGIQVSFDPTLLTKDVELTPDQEELVQEVIDKRLTPDEKAKIEEWAHEFANKLTRLPPEDLDNELQEFFKEADASIAASKAALDEGNQLIEKSLADQIHVIITLDQFKISYANLMILMFREGKLLEKYTFERRMLRIKQEAIRIFFLLIILTLGVGLFFSLIPVWWLSLLLLPIIAWFLTDHYIQPYLEKRLFTPGKRKDLKKLLSEFYDSCIKARCYLALAKYYLQTQKDESHFG